MRYGLIGRAFPSQGQTQDALAALRLMLRHVRASDGEAASAFVKVDTGSHRGLLGVLSPPEIEPLVRSLVNRQGGEPYSWPEDEARAIVARHRRSGAGSRGRDRSRRTSSR
jgi:hypothetical protein